MLALMVMLKSFQRLGYFVTIESVPTAIIAHLRKCLNLSAKVSAIPSVRSRRYYQKAIRTYLDIKPYNQAASKLAATVIARTALVMEHPADLLNVAIEELVKERYELPAFSTLDRLVGHIRAVTNNRLFQRVGAGLSELEQIYLDLLVEPNCQDSTATLNLLKSPPKKATLSHLKELLNKFNQLISFGDAQQKLSVIAPTKVKYFAAFAKSLDSSELREFTLNKRRTLLLCLLYQAQVKTRDHLVSMFLKRIQTIHNQAKTRLQELREKHLSQTEALLGVLSEILEVSHFGYGCNLGPNQMARHCQDGITSHMLSYTHRRHITADNLQAAIRDLINAYNRLHLPKCWGTGERVAADGSKFEVYENNLFSEYHIRYGGYGGIAYHHVSDTYIALFTHFITCGVWEAVYILDGLLKNTSDIQPDTLHADTHGQSAPVFALSYLLGIKLMPRIRNWQDYTFFRPNREEVYEYIEPLFKGVVDWQLINTHWQDLMRVVLSIKAGKLMPSTLLRKLGSYSRKNRLYQAFRCLGQALRTLFLLEYISNRSLRQEITACTNKVENYHGFLDWLFFGKDGVITENDPSEQEKRVKYLDLVASAVILQNAVDISLVVQQLSAEGVHVSRELLATLSPYLTRHIKRYGDYVVDWKNIPQPWEQAIPLPLSLLET
jgi:TnpA family transposase